MAQLLQSLIAGMWYTKSMLMFFNLGFTIIGLCYIAVGLCLVTHLNKYMEMSTEFSETLPFIFISIGAAIAIVCTLACVCTWKGQPALLYLYGGFLSLIFVLLCGLGVAVFAYRTKLLAGFEKGITDSMMHYRSDNMDRINDFDEIQKHLKCCGNHKYSDWLDLTPPIPIPPSCCIKADCDPANEDEIYNQGCYDKVMDYMRDNMGSLAIVGLVAAALPLIGAFLSCCLAQRANKARYQQMA